MAPMTRLPMRGSPTHPWITRAVTQLAPLLRERLGSSVPWAQPVRNMLQQVLDQEKLFWGVVLALGVISGLGAVMLINLLRAIQALAWGTGEGTFLALAQAAGPYRRFLVPTSAGLVVVVASILIRQPLKGHGTTSIIEAIRLNSGWLSLRRAVVRGSVAIGVVALGAPLGREGALLQFGAASGSFLARRLRLTPHQIRVLVACGAAAGLAAAYNVPIGAAIFALEVFFGSFALELFGPIFVSCVVGTLVSRVLIANHPSYIIPRYDMGSMRDLGVILALGPLFGVASALYVQTINRFSSPERHVPRRLAFAMPVLAMLPIGAAAIFFPQLLGNGYDTVNNALLGELPLLLLLVLPFAKMVATSLSAGAGIPGGLFTPSLYYGALLGGGLGEVAHRLLPGLAPSGAYALIGMGAVLASTTHAPVSAVLIIFELTGNYGIILPLMATSVIALAVSRKLSESSLYTANLRRTKATASLSPAPGWLRPSGIGPVLKPAIAQVAPGVRFDALMERLLTLPPGEDLYVVNRDGALLGVVSLDGVKGLISDRPYLEAVVAADVMEVVNEPLRDGATLSEAASRFMETDRERLPVVDAKMKLLGTVAQKDLLGLAQF